MYLLVLLKSSPCVEHPKQCPGLGHVRGESLRETDLRHIGRSGRTGRNSTVVPTQKPSVGADIQIHAGHLQTVESDIGVPGGFHRVGFLFPGGNRGSEISANNLLFRGVGITGNHIRPAKLDAFPGSKHQGFSNGAPGIATTADDTHLKVDFEKIRYFVTQSGISTSNL